MGKYRNILLVSGGQRNVGKTTFICQVIPSVKESGVTAVKITPHFHEVTPGLQPIAESESWCLFKETNTSQEKDTSLYLQAGAKNSFFLQTKKEYIHEAFLELYKYLPNEIPVIIESAGLVDLIKPGLFVVILPDGKCLKKEIENKLMVADLIVISDGKKFYPEPARVVFENGWTLKTRL